MNRQAPDPLAGSGDGVDQAPSSDRSDAQQIAAAARMRLSRARRREGLQAITFHLRECEIAELTRRGLLSADARHDCAEIARALGRLLDRMLT